MDETVLDKLRHVPGPVDCLQLWPRLNLILIPKQPAVSPLGRERDQLPFTLVRMN